MIPIKDNNSYCSYLQQLCTNTGCSLKNLPEVVDDWDKWQEGESGKSVLAAQHDDEDDDCFNNQLL